MPVIPHHFSRSGLEAGAKLPCYGVTAALLKRLAAGVRSLKIEHVSPEVVVPQEICRCTSPGRLAARTGERGAAVVGRILPAIHRRRPRTRKLDAGFLLTGIPATLLHAPRFDEWLEACAEMLAGGRTACASGRLAAIR
jgi:hypothetical protein